MSLACGVPLLECVYCLACARWAWKRCLHSGSHDSDTWGLASPDEFEPVPRMCRFIMANYETDITNPQFALPNGYQMDPDSIITRKNYTETKGRVTPYLIYIDHEHSDIVLALRGLNLAIEGEYAVLLDNRLGKRKFDGGYVHNGLLRAAGWVLDKECEVLKDLIAKYPDYTLTFAGHSLGSGVAAMLTMLVVLNRGKLGNLDKKRIRCYAIAPARCMSLNLAVRYADVINSIVLQDDFLPRTATPLEDIFKSILCLPCLLCMRCMRDTCVPEDVLLRDPRRLYAPGRVYHIVERKLFRCGTYPPIVRTAVPVDGRFEHIVMSCNATQDHAIIMIERKTSQALDEMVDKEPVMSIPPKQKMERQATLKREHNEEHKAALRRAVTLSIPEAQSLSEYGTFDENSNSLSSPEGENSHFLSTPEGSSHGGLDSISNRTRQRISWGELIDRIFEKDESGHMVLRKSRSSEGP